MITFSHEKILPHTYRIRTPFGVCVYYVQGTERGLLIDTGMGAGDLKSYVDSIASSKYDVILTHGHCDHAGGASQFENVYLNEKDLELEKTHASLEHRIYDVFHAPFGTPEGVTEKDFVPQRKEGYIPLDGSMRFELGDVSVSFIPLPGHTAGTMVPLIEEDRAAVIGDGLGENTLLHFPESQPVPVYKEALVRLAEKESLFDTCLRFHGSCVSDKKIIRDTIELCDEVMQGKDAAVPMEMMGYKSLMARKKEHPGKEGNFLYDPAKAGRSSL